MKRIKRRILVIGYAICFGITGNQKFMSALQSVMAEELDMN